jgi:hypothetical protein
LFGAVHYPSPDFEFEACLCASIGHRVTSLEACQGRVDRGAAVPALAPLRELLCVVAEHPSFGSDRVPVAPGPRFTMSVNFALFWTIGTKSLGNLMHPLRFDAFCFHGFQCNIPPGPRSWLPFSCWVGRSQVADLPAIRSILTSPNRVRTAGLMTGELFLADS